MMRTFYIETYGCQMNVSDSEIVVSILEEAGYKRCATEAEAQLVLLNTCAIRDSAEQTIRRRLGHLNARKRREPALLVGVLGCMAERLKDVLVEESLVDIVVGPDAYRSLPVLVAQGLEGMTAVNTFLSREETYADIAPVRLQGDGLRAFISIMRGCDNMCSFCVVPFTRGRERSRDVDSIVSEARALFERGYREVTLLGQNVDSYMWSRLENNKVRLKKLGGEGVILFADVLEAVARVHPELRVRFSTSHPQDMTDDVLHVMRRYDNICRSIHLPVQSGSSRILALMNRGYDRGQYFDRIRAIRAILGDSCGISTDIITGFCTETQADHEETLSLMERVQYDAVYKFMYSERPGTLAARRYTDDVSMALKKVRLQEVITVSHQNCFGTESIRGWQCASCIDRGVF